VCLTKRLLVSIPVTVCAALLFALVYPAVRGEAANSPDDKLGEMLGTFGIPLVMLLSLFIPLYRERRRERRESQQDGAEPSTTGSGRR